VEEAEAEVLQSGGQTRSGSETLGVESGDPSTLALGEELGDNIGPQERGVAATSINRARLASLSAQYTEDLTGQRYEIEAFAVDNDDVILTGLRCPWTMRRTTAGPWEFYVDTKAAVFRSLTFTPLDAMLTQLAWLISDFERDLVGQKWSFETILTSLREKYATTSMLEPYSLVSEASAQLTDIARSIVGRISVEDARSFFDDLSPSRQENIRVNMASRGVSNPHGAIDDGRFLQYSSPSTISEFVLSNPAMFFDGSYWDECYSSLDYGSAVATEEAKGRLLGHYGGLLADAVWLAQQGPAELATMSRERLMRASLATALLVPTADVGEDG
jgi:hypothetical protein